MTTMTNTFDAAGLTVTAVMMLVTVFLVSKVALHHETFNSNNSFNLRRLARTATRYLATP